MSVFVYAGPGTNLAALGLQIPGQPGKWQANLLATSILHCLVNSFPFFPQDIQTIKPLCQIWISGLLVVFLGGGLSQNPSYFLLLKNDILLIISVPHHCRCSSTWLYAESYAANQSICSCCSYQCRYCCNYCWDRPASPTSAHPSWPQLHSQLFHNHNRP